MKRNIQKTIDDYQKRFGYKSQNTNAAAFYLSDIDQIRELAKERSRGSQYDYEFNLVSYALDAGFMIGYRKAKADARKGKV